MSWATPADDNPFAVSDMSPVSTCGCNGYMGMSDGSVLAALFVG